MQDRQIQPAKMDPEYFSRKLHARWTTSIAIIFISQCYLVAKATEANQGLLVFLLFSCVAFSAWISRLCVVGEIVSQDILDVMPVIDKMLVLLSFVLVIAIGFLSYFLLRKLQVTRIFSVIVPITGVVVSFAAHYLTSSKSLRADGFSLKSFSTPLRSAVMIGGYTTLLFMLIRFGAAMVSQGDLP